MPLFCRLQTLQYADFDAIVAAMMEWGRDDPIIFNCQVWLECACAQVCVPAVHWVPAPSISCPHPKKGQEGPP